MEYKRLTEILDIETKQIVYKCELPAILQRLAELEDKIECGELIENKVITYVNMGRSNCKTLIDKALKYDELKTKIENGTLIELPCKVGDKIWYVSHIRIEEDRAINILEEWDVEKIDIYEGSIICRLTHEGTDHYNTARNDEFGERWFVTKDQAEAKLKELKKV